MAEPIHEPHDFIRQCPPDPLDPDLAFYEVETVTECAGLSAFTSDPAKYEIEEVTQTECLAQIAAFEGDPNVEVEEVVGGNCKECACCPCSCCTGNGYWTQYILTASGFANNGANPCEECTKLNGTFTLHWRGECNWTTDEQSTMVNCGGGVGALWSLSCSGGQWVAGTLEQGCGGCLTVNVPGENSCQCGGVIHLDTSCTQFCLSCSAWASSVTFVPSGTWVSCGGAEPNCGALMAARAAMTPEQWAIEAARQQGPGTELKTLLADLGFKTESACGCKSLARQMDRWGVDGCRQRRAEIVNRLRANQKKVKWYEQVKAAARSVQSGLAFKIRLNDIAGSLVDEAIRRAS